MYLKVIVPLRSSSTSSSIRYTRKWSVSDALMALGDHRAWSWAETPPWDYVGAECNSSAVKTDSSGDTVGHLFIFDKYFLHLKVCGAGAGIWFAVGVAPISLRVQDGHDSSVKYSQKYFDLYLHAI